MKFVSVLPDCSDASGVLFWGGNNNVIFQLQAGAWGAVLSPIGPDQRKK